MYLIIIIIISSSSSSSSSNSNESVRGLCSRGVRNIFTARFPTSHSLWPAYKCHPSIRPASVYDYGRTHPTSYRKSIPDIRRWRAVGMDAQSSVYSSSVQRRRRWLFSTHDRNWYEQIYGIMGQDLDHRVVRHTIT